jgi:hypothetical protein
MEERELEKLGEELIDILGFGEQESGTIDEETFLQIQERIENMSDLERVRVEEELVARGVFPAEEHEKYRESVFKSILTEVKDGMPQ